MRLINTATLEFEDFLDESNIPRYAILSHRWETEEVSFQEFRTPSKGEGKKGFEKIKNFCNQAAEDSFEHVWVDTCCINKDSSADLSEAINSMYRWYKHAARCYAYLCDVSAVGMGSLGVSFELQKSEWFKRGWTLQELLAPSEIAFYNKKWHDIGTKSQHVDLISKATGIPRPALLLYKPNRYSIAERMFWAANRKTTRIEDRAYSLLGIFEINMTMIYGEGHKAFQRLQEEIIKQNEDQSIFAWTNSCSWSDSDTIHQHALLARSPDDFAQSEHISHVLHAPNEVPFNITNTGLSINVQLIPWYLDVYCMRLNCLRIRPEMSDVCIYLKKQPRANHYSRVRFEGEGLRFDKLEQVHRPQSIYIDLKAQEGIESMGRYGFWIRNIPEHVFNLDRVFSRDGKWNESHPTLIIPTGSVPIAGILLLNGKEDKKQWLAIRLSFDSDFNPVSQLCAWRAKGRSLPWARLSEYKATKYWEDHWIDEWPSSGTITVAASTRHHRLNNTWVSEIKVDDERVRCTISKDAYVFSGWTVDIEDESAILKREDERQKLSIPKIIIEDFDEVKVNEQTSEQDQEPTIAYLDEVSEITKKRKISCMD